MRSPWGPQADEDVPIHPGEDITERTTVRIGQPTVPELSELPLPVGCWRSSMAGPRRLILAGQKKKDSSSAGFDPDGPRRGALQLGPETARRGFPGGATGWDSPGNLPENTIDLAMALR